jgi:hypothetical protein
MKSFLFTLFKAFVFFVFTIVLLFWFYQKQTIKSANEKLATIEISLEQFNQKRSDFFVNTSPQELTLKVLGDSVSLKSFYVNDYEAIKRVNGFESLDSYKVIQSSCDALNENIRLYNSYFLTLPSGYILRRKDFKRLDQYLFRYAKNPQNPMVKSNWDLWLETADKKYYQKALENGEIYP